MEDCKNCEFKGSACQSQCMEIVKHFPQWWEQLVSQLPAEEQKRIRKELKQ